MHSRMNFKACVVFGTRPEAIKMAPVVKALQQHPGIDCFVCVTGQHRQMLDQVLQLFAIVPDVDLNIMQAGQDLYDITSRVLLGMREVLRQHRPDVLLVHGDTTTCLAAGLAAFYAGIPVAHVEAGLRTGDLTAPFPEEANRSLVSRITRFHFAPTMNARKNLLTEAIDDSLITVTGNTVIDALLWVREKLSTFDSLFWQRYFDESLLQKLDDRAVRMVLITGHRRENFGQGFVDLCTAIRQLAQQNPDVFFIYPVHLNPNVQAPVREHLTGIANVFLIEPLEYLPFVFLMNRSYLVLTDSGGIQEEAPSLGKPVLVMRDVTERPEAVEAGTVQLVGTDSEKIVKFTQQLLDDKAFYQRMSHAHNPYGDGNSAQRIVDVLCENFHIKTRIGDGALVV
jgi:UDP-N-acetylglucosamine 2-epimerase (non-hydrolysing)